MAIRQTQIRVMRYVLSWNLGNCNLGDCTDITNLPIVHLVPGNGLASIGKQLPVT